LAGGLLITWKKDFANKITTPLLSFAAGAFLTVAFLDVLPEAVELAEEAHPIFMFTLGGFLAFFILERLLMVLPPYHKHGGHSDHTEALPLLVVLGDLMHNFLDGVVIGLSYLASPALGFTTALAIAAHEIPQEIGDFTVLLHLGWTKKKVILVNVLSSLVTIPGALLGVFAGSVWDSYLPYLLAIAAGNFLYIAASDLIPEVQHHAGHKRFASVVAPMLLSAVVIAYLVNLTH